MTPSTVVDEVAWETRAEPLTTDHREHLLAWMARIHIGWITSDERIPGPGPRGYMQVFGSQPDILGLGCIIYSLAHPEETLGFQAAEPPRITKREAPPLSGENYRWNAAMAPTVDARTGGIACHFTSLLSTTGSWYRYLPPEVARWYGLPSGNPVILVDGSGPCRIADMIDTGVSNTEILCQMMYWFSIEPSALVRQILGNEHINRRDEVYRSQFPWTYLRCILAGGGPRYEDYYLS